MKLLKDLTIDLKDKRKMVPVVVIGDVHLGNENCNLKKLNDYINWAKKNDAYVIYMGDILEMQINFRQMDSVWGADFTPREQFYTSLKLFKGLKNLVYIEGNHEFRLRKHTSIDIAEIAAKELGAEYINYGTMFKLNINKVSYDIVALHGSRSSRNPQYQLRMYDQIFDGYDIMMIGHIHALHHEEKSRLVLTDNGLEAKRIHWIRTGCFLKYPEYAFIQGMPVAVNDAPILFLGSKEKLIKVHTSGLKCL